MTLYDQIRKISLIFFFIIGLAHFLAGLFFINGYFAPQSGLVNRVLFIPFVLSAMCYAFSNIKYHLLENNKDAKWISYVMIGTGLAVFIGLLVIELLVVDSKIPLTPTA